MSSGAIVAGLLHRFATPLESETGQIFRDIHYRSIFTGGSDHEANQHLRRHDAIRRRHRLPLHRPGNAEVDDTPRRA